MVVVNDRPALPIVVVAPTLLDDAELTDSLSADNPSGDRLRAGSVARCGRRLDWSEASASRLELLEQAQQVDLDPVLARLVAAQAKDVGLRKRDMPARGGNTEEIAPGMGRPALSARCD
jgi:hypothetical protein